MERIPVRFDRDLKPEWLDFALDQAVKCGDDQACRKVLRGYLEGQLTGQEAQIKTITQLMRIVGSSAPIPTERLLCLHEQLVHLSPDQRTPIRLQLLLESSPFFNDCVIAIRRLSILGQEGIPISQLYERIITIYGDRAIVPRSVRHVLTTLLWLGLLEKRQDRRWVPSDTLLAK